MRTIDLFSGCGGLSLGFQNAGFNIQAAFDNWDSALAVYKANFDHPIHKLDLASNEAPKTIYQLNRPLLIDGKAMKIRQNGLFTSDKALFTMPMLVLQMEKEEQ